MNLLTPCVPVFPRVRAEMRPEEAQALDVILHLTMPELVVEIGTFHGGSACVFARHAQVVTFDPAPQVPPGTFDGLPITQVIGAAPGDLPKLDSYVTGKRWLLFHDSVHTPEFLLDEIAWGFSRGAFAAAWHDVALDRMLDALPMLKANGIPARRVMDFGLERSTWQTPNPEIWQGIGLAWNPKEKA